MFLKPTLIIDENICKANIRKMADKAFTNNLIFRPHFKTHQSKKIGKWFKEEGVTKITVSSVSMANYFIKDDWDDITIGFPFNIHETNSINSISNSVNINLLLESEYTAIHLSKHLKRKCGIFIKIDTGYNRTGIPANEHNTIKTILKSVTKSENLVFKGFLVHAGHTYNAKSIDEIKSIFQETKELLITLKNKFITEFPDLIISIGDTPSVSISDNFSGIDEIRPGNFVFYDAQQFCLSSCKFEDIALSLACPVVAIHKNRNEIVIYGGAVHLSKDFFYLGKKKYYGLVCKFNPDKLSEPIANTFVKSLSQEHGIISTNSSFINNIKVGDMLSIIPAHSCLTANLIGKYYTYNNKKIDHFRSGLY